MPTIRSCSPPNALFAQLEFIFTVDRRGNVEIFTFLRSDLPPIPIPQGASVYDVYKVLGIPRPDKILVNLQGDHSGSSQPPVDINTKVAF